MGQKYATWLNKSKGDGNKPRGVDVAHYVSFYQDYTLRIRHVDPPKAANSASRNKSHDNNSWYTWEGGGKGGFLGQKKG